MTQSRRQNVRERFLRDYTAALENHSASVFVGAGMSVAAGYPSWREMLREIARDLSIDVDDLSDLAALAQWRISQDDGKTNVLNAIKSQLAASKPVTAALQSLARLPIRDYWTTNYDTLIEDALKETGRPVDVRASEGSLALRPGPGAALVYKMHGSITAPNDIVIATDDYELFRRNRGSFLPLLQGQLTTSTFLFVGMSLTDPNVRHVLSLIRERFPDQPPQHYAIVRPPQRSDYSSKDIFEARHREHGYWANDLRRYGLQVIEVADFSEIDALLSEVEKRLSRRRVWVCGSWPLDAPGQSDQAQLVHDVSFQLGSRLYDEGLTLVTGFGLVVGSAAISGFIASTQRAGNWDLSRRLIARPFPQPLNGQEPDQMQWQALRVEMARLAGIVVVVGGAKVASRQLVDAEGVREEIALAEKAGAAIIPIGATGGVAEALAAEMLQASASSSRPAASKTALRSMLNKNRAAPDLVADVMGAIQTASR